MLFEMSVDHVRPPLDHFTHTFVFLGYNQKIDSSLYTTINEFHVISWSGREKSTEKRREPRTKQMCKSRVVKFSCDVKTHTQRRFTIRCVTFFFFAFSMIPFSHWLVPVLWLLFVSCSVSEKGNLDTPTTGGDFCGLHEKNSASSSKDHNDALYEIECCDPCCPLPENMTMNYESDTDEDDDYII